jgi:acetylornithine aminotransferase
MDHLMNTYARLPVAFSHGEGAWLWDQEGRRYLDAVAGIAVCNLGHAHPAVARALSEQAGRLVHTSNLYRVGLQECLAERLVALAGMDRAFFCNSGAEANEAAIKLARLHGRRRGVDVPAIVVMEGSFHGRTLATLSATGSRKVQAGFEPLVQGFVRVPYNDTEAVAAVARNRPEVVAVLVEPILGEGGVVIPDEGYLEALRKLCDAHDWLLILDEVQTGMGRTGRWLAHQHEAVVPDAVTLAKALGNGVPIGALLARGPAAGLMQPGSHGSTFGGNPLAAAAALAVLETMAGEDLPARAARMGEHLAEALATALEGMPCVREIRNRGLMLGIELDRPCGALVPRALEEGLLVNVTAERVIRLLPPLVIDEVQAGQIAATLGTLVRELCADDA